MTRNIFCALLALLLSAGAAPGAPAGGGLGRAAGGATLVKKALDFVSHNNGTTTDLYAITRDTTNDFKIYKRTTSSAEWTLWYSGPPKGSLGDPADGQYTRGLVTTLPARKTLPMLISFGNKLYTTAAYQVKYYKVSGKKYTHPEICVFELDAAGAATEVLQIRGQGYDQAGSAGFKTAEPQYSSVTDGYLFKVGTDLYWGGGGGKKIAKHTTDSGAWDAAYEGTRVDEYVYKTANGTDWTLVDRKVADQYGRDVPMAMPNGYRYNHFITFDSVRWDYYGHYSTADTSGLGAFAFTPKTDGVHTEPWGRFQMAAGDGVNATDYLFRVGFDKKITYVRGDPYASRTIKNYIYTITGTAGTWTKDPDPAGLATFDGAPNDGSVYWRTMAVLKNTDDLTGHSADPLVYNETWHNGLYALYSKKVGATYSSGIYRYADIDGNGSWLWEQVREHSSAVLVDMAATTYTGAIFAEPNVSGDSTKGAIYVGTTTGVLRRGTGRLDLGADGIPGGVDADADSNLMPQ